MAMQWYLILLLALAPCPFCCAWGSSASMARLKTLRNCRGRRQSIGRYRGLRGQHGSSQVGVYMASADHGEGSDDTDEDLWTDGKGKAWVDDGRDSLPFDIYDVVPPKRKIGTARLPPLTNTGDTMWHRSKHYKVLRVSSHYKYEGGRFVMRKKVVDAKELVREAKERLVTRLVYGDGGKPPRKP